MFRPEGRPPLTPVQWSWFAAIIVAQLIYATVLPMFSGFDERGHYYRLWALSEGHFSCATVPASVKATAGFQRWAGTREQLGDYFKRGARVPADDHQQDGWDYECFYFPSGMLLPALANRLVAEHLDGTMRVGGAFMGAYAARVTAALVVDVALLFLLLSLSRGRFTALAFFSIPEVVQQCSNINHDAFLFVLTMLMLVAALARPSWRAVLAIGAMASLMAAVKPTYALFGLLGLPHLAQLYTPERPFRWRQWLMSASLLLPLGAYWLLRLVSVDANRLWYPSFSHPNEQARLLLHNPFKVFRVFIGYFHYFIDDHTQPDFTPRLINGKWTTLLAGNAHFDMAIPGCLAVLAAMTLAVIADRYTAAPVDLAELPDPTRRLRWAWRIAIAGLLLTIPVTIIALYLIFSHVGVNYPYGVQGRYHLFTIFLLMMLGVCRPGRAPRPWTRWLALPSLALMGVGFGYAIVEVYRYYWPPLA